MTGDAPLLDVRGLAKHYPVTEGLWNREVGRVKAVDGIELAVERGETLALVGESGCGKSTAARAMLRIEEPTEGEIYFDGEDVAAYDRAELKRFRRRAQLLLQDPTAGFDPRLSIGESVAEPLRVHGMADRSRRRRLVEGTLERVGLSAADADRYPHELSGGQKQRAALARALIVDPDLLVADEPVSALDASVKASVLSLLDALRSELDLAVVLISHDLAVVREHCDRVAVMYLGEIVESGPVEAVFDDPKHPYTRALLASIPVPDPTARRIGTDPAVEGGAADAEGEFGAAELVGDVPSPADPPSGCRFHTRCPAVIPPGGFDLERPVWRRLLRLRTRLEREPSSVDVGAVREHVATERGGDVDPAGVSDDAVRAALRREFELPDRLADPDAERVLDRALSRLVNGEREAAAALLAEEFRTVCEAEAPADHAVSSDYAASSAHVAACHLHDDRSDGETEPSAATGTDAPEEPIDR